ncbi:hypothetical protein I6E68_13435 [Salinibacterium sp. NSLL150]|uniref:hypothetical protein n=1 Tax=unclassified Salinibacterium TaxID=2632331 RepID=UPI0018CE1720|nr:MULTISPECIES: hypothetical protein [unclassified Salinibacterium]MBH0025257.1 hypothetical protein [Salinibacterium sp. SWN248]MBH0100140.1 hypothetical protein [Salinibacterium sp. NSLL35]MBH0102894.1 hypothetical protein [Salinibacterium sp. NSLL150]MBH0105654.1 hypothetical protein [Salinibacterium sp. NSLL16]MBH0108414.1 hypothetical protein [Salinibacterium sp. NSLL17]
MVEWFVWVQIVVAVTAGLGAVIVGFARVKPNDYTLGATLLVELLLIVQLVMAIIAPLLGNVATGSSLEFWIYLVSAILIPPAAVMWGLIERNRWSTVILGVACLSIAIMVYRMSQIWFVQLA